MKKKLFVLSIVVAVLLISPIVSAAEEPAACSGLMKALENIPPDSPGYAKVLEMAQTKCGEALDHAALVALYISTNGDEWSYSFPYQQFEGEVWDETTHHCTWYGIRCDPDTNRVTHIHLTYNNLNGYIPDELRNLSELYQLWLHGTYPNPWGWSGNNLTCWQTQEVLDWANNLRDVTGGDVYVNQPTPGGGTDALSPGVVCGSTP